MRHEEFLSYTELQNKDLNKTSIKSNQILAADLEVSNQIPGIGRKFESYRNFTK